MKVLLKSLVATAVALSFTGCGMVSQSISSEEKYLEMAETATGVDKSQLRLDKDSINGSSITDEVTFDVYDTKGYRYKCGYSSQIPGVFESAALCTKITKDGKASGGNQGHCNELLKAAGKC